MSRRPIALIIDDEEMNRLVVDANLPHGYDTLHFDNAVDALSAIKGLKSQIDAGRLVVVITDQKMGKESEPEKDGTALIKGLAEARIRIPTIMISGNKDLDEDFKAAGADIGLVDRIFSKPLVASDFQLALAEITRQYAARSSSPTHTINAARVGNKEAGK